MDKKKVVTVNTYYPSVTKQPHEVRQESLVRRNSLKWQHDSSVSMLESKHKRDMKDLERTQKQFQKSMIDYVEMKERSRQKKAGRDGTETVFVTRRPISLDMRLLDSDRQSQQAYYNNNNRYDGGKSRGLQSPRQLNTSDPKNRSVSETIYREKSKESIGSLPSIYKKPIARPDYQMTDAFQHNSNQPATPRTVLTGSRSTVRDKDSGYSSSVVDENQSVKELGARDSMEETILDIAPFPAYETEDIYKHKRLNDEAAATSRKQKPNAFLQNLYLQRLKLQRRLASQSDQHIPKKKPPPPPPVKKQPSLREIRDIPKLIKEPNVETPPPPVRHNEKPNKVIQSFRYSYAIEDYFRKNARRVSDVSNITDFEDFEEVKNGWLVQPLGSKVLNVSPRTIPSVSPHQRRLRARLRQAQLLELRQENRSLARRRSLESRSNSRASSHDPQTKSQLMEAIPEEMPKEKPKKKEVRFPDTENDLTPSYKKATESQTDLPDINVTSSPHDTDVRQTVSEQHRNQETKSYLSLPAIPVE